MSAHDPKDTNPKVEQAGASDESIQQVHSILLREKAEPREGYSPMPLFLLGFISAMVLTVSIYFVHNRGGFDPMVFDERFDPSMATAGGPKAAVDPIANGKKLYTQVCMACHQATGAGVPGVYPPLAKSEWAQGSEERVIRILLHGLQGPLKVEGRDYNSVMPAIGPGGYNWNDEKIAHVLTYVRQEWGNAAPPVTAQKVTEVRTQGAAGRGTPWTAAELEALP